MREAGGSEVVVACKAGESVLSTGLDSGEDVLGGGPGCGWSSLATRPCVILTRFGARISPASVSESVCMSLGATAECKGGDEQNS